MICRTVPAEIAIMPRYPYRSHRSSNSLLKNQENFGFSFSCGSLLDRCDGFKGSNLTPAWLRCNEFGDADQVVGDQIEHEVGGDAADAAMFGLADGAVLLAPTEDALGHCPA